MKAKAKRLDNGKWVEGFYFRFNDTHQMALPALQVFIEIDQSTLVFPELEKVKEENAELKEALKEADEALRVIILDCGDDHVLNIAYRARRKTETLTQEKGEE